MGSAADGRSAGSARRRAGGSDARGIRGRASGRNGGWGCGCAAQRQERGSRRYTAQRGSGSPRALGCPQRASILRRHAAVCVGVIRGGRRCQRQQANRHEQQTDASRPRHEPHDRTLSRRCDDSVTGPGRSSNKNLITSSVRQPSACSTGRTIEAGGTAPLTILVLTFATAIALARRGYQMDLEQWRAPRAVKDLKAGIVALAVNGLLEAEAEPAHEGHGRPRP